MRRVLVGTVGYHNLRDFSLGPKLLPRLRALAWPPGVEVDELNWGPIAVVQHFQSLAQPYDRVVILTARRSARPAAAITLRRWQGGLPSSEEIQDRVAEAVTGVISVDNLLVVGEYFNIWPNEVLIVDVEPGPEEAGDTFTLPVEAAIPAILEITHQAVREDVTALEPLAPLRGDQLGTE